jgi:hypothetical protein
MYTVDFIPAEWVERAAFWPGLVVYSRPITIERRLYTRRATDVELLLRSLLPAQAH